MLDDAFFILEDEGNEEDVATEYEELNELEVQILEFEKRFYRLRGKKHVALSQEFGISTIRYFQILNQIIDKPAAVIAEPVLVNRLRRIRESRKQTHSRVRDILVK